MSWDKAIRESKVFFILGTESYFNDARCYCQVDYAREERKPFRVALRRGVEIPPGYFDGVEDIRIEEWSDQTELLACSARLLDDLGIGDGAAAAQDRESGEPGRPADHRSARKREGRSS